VGALAIRMYPVAEGMRHTANNMRRYKHAWSISIKIVGYAVYKGAKWENKAIEHANRGNDGSTKGAPGDALHHWSNSSATLPPKAREKQTADLRARIETQ
jgi:hypothetical protein